MDVRIDGRVALVTGGSRGIGRAVALALSGSGASVMLSSRKIDDLDRAAVSIREETGGEVGTAWRPPSSASAASTSS
jgi:NAD(P)-dependent dehydrogenase (short-subunit alcohol dehydrogenase family)